MHYRIKRCEAQKLVWFCNFKVASRSIEHAICLNCTNSRCLHTEENTNDILVFQDYFRFMFVRNPWDRLVSLYYSVPPGHKFLTKMYPQTPAKPSFQQFIKRVCSTSDRKSDVHFTSQCLLLPPLKPPLDFIGKFEQLSSDWEKLQQQFNLPDLTHAHRNKTRKPYKQYYTQELAQMVAIRYKQDIEAFGYDFKRILV